MARYRQATTITVAGWPSHLRAADSISFTRSATWAPDSLRPEASRTTRSIPAGRKEGKILRCLLEPDSSARGTEAWLPPDNPFGAGTRSAVFSVGHRNPQGLVWAHTRDFSLLFSCE